MIMNPIRGCIGPFCRYFLIWTNVLQIVLLLAKLTWIRWTVHSFYNATIVRSQPVLVQVDSSSDSSNQSNWHNFTVDTVNEVQFAQQIQFPILFMASMMCVVLYIVGLIGAIQKQYGMLLSYALVLSLLSAFNLLMTGFNPYLWMSHAFMAFVAYVYCCSLKSEENFTENVYEVSNDLPIVKT